MIEFSKPYSDSLGPSMFHYPDTSATAVSNQFTATANVRNANYNAGFAKRNAVLSGGTTVNVCIPLNRYGVVSSSRDKIAPLGKVDIDITFVSDLFGIYRANGVATGKCYFTKFVLWVPKMTFNLDGDKLYLAKYGIKQEWTYLKENVVTQTEIRQQNVVCRITPGIKNPRHVFIWVLNSNKINNQEQNPFIFDTYNMDGGHTFTECQLEIGNGVFYPMERMRPIQEISKTYRTLMQYQSRCNNYIMAPSFDQKTFQDLYRVIYFELRYQDMAVKNDLQKLDLQYTLSGDPAANYTIYDLILSEESIMVDVINSKAYLRT